MIFCAVPTKFTRARIIDLTNKIIELKITDLAFDGKSVAHHDGKVVFLKGGLPGETVEAEIIRSKARYDQGIVRKILTRSELRIEAPCQHFDQCGGCTWQDLEYASQLSFKKKQIKDCLERIGSLKDVVVLDPIGSVELFDYRNKMEFSFNAGENGSFTLGLHELGHFDRIFDIHNCLLQSKTANEIVEWMRTYTAEEKISVYNVTDHTGYLRFLVIRRAKRTSDLLVNMVTAHGPFPNQENFIKQLRKRFPEISTVVHNQTGSKSNIATGEIEKVIFGPGYFEEKLFDYTFQVKANAFFQTNSIQAETLYRLAFDILAPTGTERVLDLYCGTGSIGILLSKYVEEVIGVELVADSVTAARKNAELNHVDNITFFEGNVTEFLKTDTARSKPFDVIIVDPPRAGLHPKAVKRLIDIGPKRLVYVSCNPASFSRDAEKLTSGGYELASVQPVDMFPHTMHIELVSLFTHISDS